MTQTTPLSYQLDSAGMDHMVPHEARIYRIKDEAPKTVTYRLEFTDPEIRQGYRFLPGQFNMIYIPGIGEAAISVSSDPSSPENLLHTIRAAGNVTQKLTYLEDGSKLGVRGPYGSAWPMDFARGGDVIIVGGGIGLAPLRPAIYHLINNRDKYGKITVLVGARAPKDLLYPTEYPEWAAHEIEVIQTVDRADATWKHRVGVVPMLFYSLRPDSRRTTLFTCGPEIMMRFVIYEALARRIPKNRIFVSLERNMKCALGFCGHCQFGPYFLCKEGPVLTFEKVEPFFSVEEF